MSKSGGVFQIDDVTRTMSKGGGAPGVPPIQVQTPPTWLAGYGPVIFTNSEHISNYGILNLNISGHEIIYITRKKKKEQFNLIKTIGRSYLSYNRELFQSQLINANWDAFQHISDVNLYWTNLENKIRETIDKMCPLRKMNIKDRGDPWMTNELIRKSVIKFT